MESKRAHSGIDGLDEILRGGLPRNRIYLVQGLPGTGKTTLALQFLLQGAKDGERGLYIALSECQDEIQEVALSHGWDLSGIGIFTLSSAQQLVTPENQNTVFKTATVELTETETLLCERIKLSRPARVVIDSLSEVRLLAAEPWVYRQQLLRLKDFLNLLNVTTLFLEVTVKEMSEAESPVYISSEMPFRSKAP
jgi:circadian clock protein KaiC